MIVVGGVIPPGDFDELYAAGATAIFPPGTVIADAAIGLLHKLAERLGYDLKLDGRPRSLTSSAGGRPQRRPLRAGAGHHAGRVDPGRPPRRRRSSCCWP